MKKVVFIFLFLFSFLSVPGYGMHIAEGILSGNWVIVWFLVALPFVIWSIIVVVKKAQKDSNYFVGYCVDGSCSFAYNIFGYTVAGSR